MIPWRLTFSGIRDFPPTLLDLSEPDEHVLITGPNGAGKSTITFCMGAVLYSSKVDVEGLKSRNLPADQTWKARISLLFQNEGLMKIDAPPFIEFTLKISQDPGQPMKKEFIVATGEVIDEWEETIRYTSGDRFFNFSAYKKDLQYKYKVDSDHFYLIWFQQEVNQFAVMNPEERFRIFSEMHGIDKVQRDWEESMEKVKETEETLRSAETNVKLMKQELSMKKTALDRFTDNQKRLHEGGQLYVQSLLQLEKYYKKEKAKLTALVEQLEVELADAIDDLALNKGLKERKLEQLKAYKIEQQQLDSKIESNNAALVEMGEKIKEVEGRISELNQELAEITSRKKQITRTAEEVNIALLKLTSEEQQTNTEYEQNQQKLQEIKTTRNEKVEKITRIKVEVEKDDQAELVHYERLRQYQSSHAVQRKIDSLDSRLSANKDTKYIQARRADELQEELKLLEEDRDLSARQVESLKFFRSQQLKAYALRELIELDGDAQLKAEQLFNAIKYTIFFDGKYAEPPNDLYHVPLMTVVPDRMVNSLPSLHLQVKDGLSENVLPHAIKALWWVEQFFKDHNISIKNGILIDPMGIRGSQEKSRYILSVKALIARKQEVGKLLQKLLQSLSQLDIEIETDTKEIRELNSIIHQVKESEAFMTNEHERILRKKKLADELELQINIDEEIEQLEVNGINLVRLQLSHEQLRTILEDEAALYAELGKMKEKYEERNLLQKQLEKENEKEKTQKGRVERLEDDRYQLKRKIIETEREQDNLEQAIEGNLRNKSSIENQQKNKNEEIETTKHELVKIIKELNDLQLMIPELYSETVAAVLLELLPSVSQIRQNRESGKVAFDNARMEADIDPAAPENYQTVKLEYERLDNEYKRTKILLDQDKERMENLKDQLETTINMRVLELQQRFKSYMGQFQFEGEISWESYEDRRKRTHFNLFIKARKEGHRGTLEDVSTKARGGRVGKGVSGGEESLSSLLFALALLQNLQTTPGFIVLDEFDSALDENRKVKVFDLYVQELRRKLIILTPKSHEETYLDKFSKAFVVQHDPTIPKSKVVGIVKTR